MITTDRPGIPGKSYIEWSAILAGAIFAIAISLVLFQFGSAIGLSATSDTYTNDARLASWGIVATGIWILWVQLLASLGGGYIAGRMRGPLENPSSQESEIRDGIHGLMTWATATVAMMAGAAAVAAISTAIASLAETQTGASIDVTQTQAMLDLDKNTGLIFAFVTGATSLLSAVAAWWAATMGGDHRDKNVDLGRYLSFRKIVITN